VYKDQYDAAVVVKAACEGDVTVAKGQVADCKNKVAACEKK